MLIFACNSLKLSFKLLSMTDVGNHHEDQRIKVPKNLVSKFLILGNFWQYLVSLGNFSVFCEQNRDRPSRCMSRYLKYPPPATSITVSSCLKLSQAFSNLENPETVFITTNLSSEYELPTHIYGTFTLFLPSCCGRYKE